MAKQSDKLTPAVPEEMEPMVREWCWFLSLGIGLVVLGFLDRSRAHSAEQGLSTPLIRKSFHVPTPTKPILKTGYR